MMTLEEMLLPRLADWRPDSSRPTLDVAHPDSGWNVSITAECADTLGCRLREVVLTRTAPLDSQGSLADQADRIANRVSGLLEPLCLVEVDGEHQLAQLRSREPSRRGDDLHYYEVLRHADGTTRLGRYQASPQAGSKRQAIGFALTHEALARVVSDLASA
jgi:hypothetical protein